MGKGIRYHTGPLRKAAACLVFGACLLAQSPIADAIRLTREKHYSEANRILEKVPEPSGHDQQIAFHRLKAAIASGLNDFRGAVREMRSALALDPKNSNLLLATALAELQSGQLDDALEHARESAPGGMRESIIGEAEERRGNSVAAAQAYESAIKLEPDQEQYRIALGVQLIRHQTFTPAIDLLSKSAVLFPKSAEILELLGIAQYAAGYTEDAVKSLQSAITTDPKLASAYQCLAKIVLQSSAAPDEHTASLLCSRDQTVCSALKSRIARETGNHALQTQAIAQLKSVRGQSVMATCELGRAYEWSGELAEARAETEQCVHLDPSPQNHYRLGLLYRKLGLNDLAAHEMAERTRTLKAMSDETALGLNALQNFEHSPE